ncbi:MAG: hypothetical protein CM15mP77_4500 [Synechococcus sp.]|nr:MAG: hypothetical protein CM15mP77_4500 [Synechococcus sp.]
MRPHNGLDIAAPLGSCPQLVVWSLVETHQCASCGIGVVVASGGYEHIYCHLQQQRMLSGQAVRAGQVIGQVGMTGRTSGRTCTGEPNTREMARSGADSQRHDSKPPSQRSCRPLTLRVIPDQLP